MGLSRLVDLKGTSAGAAPTAAFGRMAERSTGKDSVTGHWELMGHRARSPVPDLPATDSPQTLIAEFEARIGRKSIGNVGRLGHRDHRRAWPEHMETGFPIVYTSADSVFQIAAHEGIVPVPQLYEWCEAAYELAVKGLGLGRVIARPFIGAARLLPAHLESPRLRACRRSRETLLDRLVAQGHQVAPSARSRICSPGRGISSSIRPRATTDGMDADRGADGDAGAGLIFANLVDFDAVYGHRNDTAGYAANLERFDARLAALLPKLRRTICW